MVYFQERKKFKNQTNITTVTVIEVYLVSYVAGEHCNATLFQQIHDRFCFGEAGGGEEVRRREDFGRVFGFLIGKSPYFFTYSVQLNPVLVLFDSFSQEEEEEEERERVGIT